MLGVVGVLIGLIPILFFLAWLVGGVALICGLVGRNKARRTGVGKGQATAGIVLGGIAVALGVVGIVIINAVLEDTSDELSQLSRDFERDLNELNPPPTVPRATTSTATTGSPPVTPHTAPPFPDQIQGYTHESAPVTLTFRAFARQPNYIPDFPATMNGCDLAVITTRWRSLGGNVTAGNADPHLAGFPVPTAPRDSQVAQAGLIQGNQCEEPVFFLPTEGLGTIVDVSVEYLVWQPSS